MKIMTSKTYDDMQDQIKQVEQTQKYFANYKKKTDNEISKIKAEAEKLQKDNSKLSVKNSLLKQTLENTIHQDMEELKNKIRSLRGTIGGLKKQNNKLKTEKEILENKVNNYKKDFENKFHKPSVIEYEQKIKKVRK